MTAYYNENDPGAAAWLRELITAGLIAPGDVDERSITDVRAGDLTGYTQCHFFAGIGGWSLALRLAGWPDDQPVWTGSPPCQPFSSAGKRGGYDDARHLAPAWLDLVSKCRPPVVYGEQVASAINGKHAWLDDLQDHMEAEGYATGAVVLPACSVGAPHIRQRLWFVAQRLDDAASARHDGKEQGAESYPRDEARVRLPGEGCGPGGRADAIGSRLEGLAGHGNERHEPGRIGSQQDGPTAEQGAAGGMDEPNGTGPLTRGEAAQGSRHGHPADTARGTDRHGSASPDHGVWSDTDWLYCRDGKWRPVRPGSFPLAHGIPARVGRLRGYGNAIVPQVAAEVIRATMEAA